MYEKGYLHVQVDGYIHTNDAATHDAIATAPLFRATRSNKTKINQVKQADIYIYI